MKPARRFCFFVGLMTVLGFLFPRDAWSQEKIRLAHSALESSNGVWYVAQDRGFYKKHGLDADLLFIPSTTTSVSSLVAGDVQVANASGGGVASAVVAGADLVLFSGDKLLGGPQAGIIAGRRDLIERLRKRPMARAMRIDKLSLAGLRATLELYLPPHDPFAEIPVLRMLGRDAPEDRVAERHVGDQIGVARRDAEIGLREHHVQVG